MNLQGLGPRDNLSSPQRLGTDPRSTDVVDHLIANLDPHNGSAPGPARRGVVDDITLSRPREDGSDTRASNVSEHS